MRAAALLGVNTSAGLLRRFQAVPGVEWSVGCPVDPVQTDAVVIFGGDGTVHRYLAALVELNLPVLVVPCGSGNDFARELGLGTVASSLEAWRNFIDGRCAVRGIDLLVVQDRASGKEHYVCCAGGVGLDAEAAGLANRLPRWLRARGGYALSALLALLRFKPQQIKILLEGENEPPPGRQNPLLCVAFANSPAYGGGMKIAPWARLDDGKLDVCIISGMSWARFLWLFPSVYAGRHLRDRHVEYAQSAGLRIETEAPLNVSGDGEYLCKTPVQVRVERNALRVIQPAK